MGSTKIYEGAYGEITVTSGADGTWVHNFHLCVRVDCMSGKWGEDYQLSCWYI